jgi:hypothetical protein
MLTTNSIYTTAYQLERKVQAFNKEDSYTDWYKTYDVLYLDPIDNRFKIIQAWPAVSEKGIVWTKTNSDVILNSDNIYLTFKHYEEQKENENNP